MKTKLSRITIQGFRTIRALDGFMPGPINILIGANGAGKSNFISFFKFLAWMTPPPGNLQFHVAESGGASKLLFDGPTKTRDITGSLTLKTEQGVNDYEFRLAFAAGDTFIFAEEKYRFSRTGFPSLADWTVLGVGHKESELIKRSEIGEVAATTIHSLLRGLKVYQFHNTSMTARMRNRWNREDNRFLKEDAANIAPFLFRLSVNEERSYSKIVETIRLIIPFFSTFIFEDDEKDFLLKWKERESDEIFNASQAADGMLRIIALIALLLQPRHDLPDVLILDEPELGLHPFAINVVAGLLRSASLYCQIIIATQSTTFLDNFDPADVIIVERKNRETIFKKIDEQSLKEWIEEYTLSELWEKNVIGGRPK